MSKSTDMEQSLAIERLFMEKNWEVMRTALSPFLDLRDVRDNATAQAEGYDYMGILKPECHPKSEGPFKPCATRLEFKADTNKPNNVCAEFLSQVHLNKKLLVAGWLLTSNANWLLYGFSQSRELLVVPMVAFRRYAIQKAMQASATSRFNSGPRYFSYCSLLPIEAILREVPGSRLFKLGVVEGEPKTTRIYAPLHELGALLAAFPGGVLNIGEGSPFEMETWPLALPHRTWRTAEGQKKLCQMLAQLRKNDISARKNEDAHRIEATLYAQRN